MPELWQHVLRTPDGDATFDRMSYSEEVTEYDVDERRPPFSESPFFLGTGLAKPIEVTFKIRLRGATMADAEQELANLLYVLQNVTNWIYQGRIATARWTGTHNIQPTLLGYIVTFNLTLGDVAVFDGEFTDIEDPPPEPESVNPWPTGGRNNIGSIGFQRFNELTAINTLTITGIHLRLGTPEDSNYRLTIWRVSDQVKLHDQSGISSPAGVFTEVALSTPVFVEAGEGVRIVMQRFPFVSNTGQMYEYISPTDPEFIASNDDWTFVAGGASSGVFGNVTPWDTYPTSSGSATRQVVMLPIYFTGGSAPPPDPTSDPDPTPVGGLVLAMPALGDFQARGGDGASKVAYSQFSRVPQALNRTFDAGSPSNFNHPSIGSFSIRQSGADKLYFFCFTEIFEVTNAASLTIVSRGSNGLGVSTYDRNFQWSRVTNNQYYAVRNGDLLRFTVGSLTPTTLCSRARVLAELGLSPFDSQAVRWGGPGEMTIVSNPDGLGKEMAFGYVRTGASALTVFAYNVTDDDILGTVQNITFTTEAELYFDYIGVSVQGDYGIMKPRPQSSSLDVDYWIFPLTLSGVGSRILGASSISTGHASFGLTKSGSTYIDGFYTFTDEQFNLLDLSDGTVALNKAIEGQWSQHIGHVYWTHGFVSYDSSGRAAFEFSDGSGGYGLGDGWDTQGYVQIYYDKPTGDVFVMGRRGGLPEIRYWDA